MRLLLKLWTVQNEVSSMVNSIVCLLIDGGTSVHGGDYTALSYCSVFLTVDDIDSQDKTLFLQIFSQHNVPAFSSRPGHIDCWVAVGLFIAIPDIAIGK